MEQSISRVDSPIPENTIPLPASLREQADELDAIADSLGPDGYKNALPSVLNLIKRFEELEKSFAQKRLNLPEYIRMSTRRIVAQWRAARPPFQTSLRDLSSCQWKLGFDEICRCFAPEVFASEQFFRALRSFAQQAPSGLQWITAHQAIDHERMKRRTQPHAQRAGTAITRQWVPSDVIAAMETLKVTRTSKRHKRANVEAIAPTPQPLHWKKRKHSHSPEPLPSNPTPPRQLSAAQSASPGSEIEIARSAEVDIPGESNGLDNFDDFSDYSQDDSHSPIRDVDIDDSFGGHLTVPGELLRIEDGLGAKLSTTNSKVPDITPGNVAELVHGPGTANEPLTITDDCSDVQTTTRHIQILEDLEPDRKLHTYTIDAILQFFASASACTLDIGDLPCLAESRLSWHPTGTFDRHLAQDILIPLHVPDRKHWVCLHLDRRNKVATLYDSLLSAAPDHLEHVTAVTVSAISTEDWKDNGWKLTRELDTQQQQNDYDCGIFTAVRCIQIMTQRYNLPKINASHWRRFFRFLFSGESHHLSALLTLPHHDLSASVGDGDSADRFIAELPSKKRDELYLLTVLELVDSWESILQCVCSDSRLTPDIQKQIASTKAYMQFCAARKEETERRLGEFKDLATNEFSLNEANIRTSLSNALIWAERALGRHQAQLRQTDKGGILVREILAFRARVCDRIRQAKDDVGKAKSVRKKLLQLLQQEPG